MPRTLSKVDRCTSCGTTRDLHYRLLVCGASSAWGIHSFPSKPRLNLLDDFEVWKFPLCVSCMKEGYCEFLKNQKARHRAIITYSVIVAVLSFILIILRGVPLSGGDKPLGLLDTVLCFLSFAAPFVAIVMGCALYQTSRQLRRMQAAELRGLPVEKWEDAFRGEAERIIGLNSGHTHAVTVLNPRKSANRPVGLRPEALSGILKIPAFVPYAKLPESIAKRYSPDDVQRSIDVISVGSTLDELIGKLPKRWEECRESLKEIKEQN